MENPPIISTPFNLSFNRFRIAKISLNRNMVINIAWRRELGAKRTIIHFFPGYLLIFSYLNASIPKLRSGSLPAGRQVRSPLFISESFNRIPVGSARIINSSNKCHQKQNKQTARSKNSPMQGDFSRKVLHPAV